ncbi:MAG: AzlC family ABC transporter permease [Sneathiella sp.]
MTKSSEVSLAQNLSADSISSRTEILQGIRDALPVLVAVIPFSAVFGAVAIESGLTFIQMLVTSLSIYAVASQYVMLDLMGQGVPAWSVILAVFAVNFRHVLYSASVGRHMGTFSNLQKAVAFFLLVDPQYAACEARAAKQRLRPAYYFSYAATVYLTWIGVNCIGALFGSFIEDPTAFGLDFILPLYFTGLVLGFRQRAGFLPVLVASGCVSLLTYFTIGSPWHITIGGGAGLVVAAVLSKPVMAEEV